MRSWGLSLLLLSAVTLDSCLSQASGRDIQDDTRIIEAVKRFNLEENVPYLYKPLDDVPPALLEEKENSRTLSFSIKETVCPKHAKRDLTKCAHQRHGKIQDCKLVMTQQRVRDTTCKLSLKAGAYSLHGRPGKDVTQTI
ncbi:antibacterial peptide PMAP-23-like isoform X2 [Pseudophryne corroboree]|uniref:antibacterial peptide PMAP-23-like isoform X2 n=1 Tax=Pseudophryne corroboree TaxID=495146 RepID=UPI0030819647